MIDVTNPAPAHVSMPTARSVEVTRSFAARRTLVYRAFTEPELIRRWMLGPPGWSMAVCEMDVRVGGQYLWRWRSSKDGSEFGFHGEFLAVEAPTLLSHTEVYDPESAGGSMGEAESMVTTRFTEEAGATTVTTRIEYESASDRDTAVATGMGDGMEQSYQLLDGLLAEGNGD